MIAPVRTLLYGAADRAQALEAARLGVDAIAVAVGEGGGKWLPRREATALLGALPPLVGRLIHTREGPVPAVAHAVIVDDEKPPRAARVWIRRASQATIAEQGPPAGASALWVEPSAHDRAASTAYDYHAIERLSRALPLMLEATDGAAGVEALIRLGRPQAVIFGEAVWHHPGIVDLARLEDALAVVARLNKAAYR